MERPKDESQTQTRAERLKPEAAAAQTLAERSQGGKAMWQAEAESMAESSMQSTPKQQPRV